MQASVRVCVRVCVCVCWRCVEVQEVSACVVRVPAHKAPQAHSHASSLSASLAPALLLMARLRPCVPLGLRGGSRASNSAPPSSRPALLRMLAARALCPRCAALCLQQHSRPAAAAAQLLLLPALSLPEEALLLLLPVPAPAPVPEPSAARASASACLCRAARMTARRAGEGSTGQQRLPPSSSASLRGVVGLLCSRALRGAELLLLQAAAQGEGANLRLQPLPCSAWWHRMGLS